MEAFIKAVAYYLPENEFSNQELAELFPEWAADKIAAKIGVRTRHIAAEDEYASDLAIAAAQRLFNENGIPPATIDFVLYCTQSPDYFLPSTSCVLQHKLGIPVTAGALDFNLGCSGYVYGLALAKGLIAAGIARNILLLTAETYSKFIHPEDKGNRTIFGDGASATVVSTNGFAKIGEFVLGTDGSGADNLIVRNGALKHPSKITGELDNYLFMDGPEIFSFSSKEVPLLVKATLDKHGLVPENIDQYLFHQANLFMLTHLRKKIGIPAEKFYTHMAETGNTVSATIPIAIREAIKETSPQKAQKWLLAGFGVGYSWGATILTFN